MKAVKRLQNVTGCMYEADINNRLYALICSFMAECAACGVCRIVFSSIHKQKKAAPSPELHNRTDLNTFPAVNTPIPYDSHPILNNDHIILALPNTDPAPMTLEGAPNG